MDRPIYPPNCCREVGGVWHRGAHRQGERQEWGYYDVGAAKNACQNRPLAAAHAAERVILPRCATGSRHARTWHVPSA
jgi:hypothetical protein